ncbi:SPRY domain-containing SOCS box protein 3-like [Venturia canescens]|uniref:SPRY domain-containing SOCS box protein 3-like n=1 Tax=Venturia canescens TaxID=32260 RepID=UPI001C9C10C5|nr:SPRY domain-containing SOCS box protein 3-like [Venturia canescens]
MNLDYDPVRLLNFEGYCSCAIEDCNCGEQNVHEWSWDETLATSASLLSRKNLEVKFHPNYSNGTVAVRGNKPMEKARHHYWEIKMLTPIYGTDVMVGVGTSKAELEMGYTFCSLLGHNRESWGFSYKGHLQHAGETREYAQCFGQKSLVGVHLDTWKGTLQFFLNRKALGVAFTGLRNVELYPMVSSTAAQSQIRITHSCSAPASLQMECLGLLRPLQRSYLTTAFPGLQYLSKSIFADILRKEGSDKELEYDYEYPEEYLILDDMSYALVGFGRRRKRKNLDPAGPGESSSSVPELRLKKMEI